MKPINEAEESLLKSVQRDNKDKRDLVLKVLEDMKENINSVPIYAGSACMICPPFIREEFIDYLMEDKEIIDIFWTYGDEFTLLTNESRHYVDMNLHVKVKNYDVGDDLEVNIKYPDGDELWNEEKEINLKGKVNEEKEVVFIRVFKDGILNLK